MLLQGNTVVQVPDQDGPEPPGHVKKRLTKKLQFLERVADSKHKALAATAGIKKKPHKSKYRQKKAFPDLNSLAELLADVDQKQQKHADKQEQHGAVQTNKQKGRTEQINGSKARRNVTYALSSGQFLLPSGLKTPGQAFGMLRAILTTCVTVPQPACYSLPK